MSFDSHQTQPTINTTPQSATTTKEQVIQSNDDKKRHERNNSSVSNLINAFENKNATKLIPDEQNRARADWRVSGDTNLVAPVFPAPVLPTLLASAPRDEGRQSPEQMMDPEQMMNQQRCLFDTDDERTEMSDEPSTILQLDANGRVSSEHGKAFDASLLFLGNADPASVQPVASRAQSATRVRSSKTEQQSDSAFSTNKNNDVEYFGQFKRETLQRSEPAARTITTANTTTFMKPRRRRNTTVTTFLSSFPRRNQKSAAHTDHQESYHQLDDDDDGNTNNSNKWGTTKGSPVASNMVHPDLGDDGMHQHDGADYDYDDNDDDDDYPHDDIVRDAMKSINGTEQVLRDADSFFAAGSFYEALDDGLSLG
jgi:hypothetical protein